MNALMANPRVRSAAEVFGPGLVIIIGTILIFGVNPIAEPGVYVIGLVFGMLGALTALGMALIYRSNRILNFAQGELGLAPSVAALGLITFSAMPYVFALLFGLGAALLLGVVVEFVIIRRFAKSPRLILTVATIGLSQLLTVASLAIPMIWDRDPMSQKIVAPFDFKFEVAPITFTGNHLIALVVAPIVILAVAIFLKSTNIGIAVRASAERADRANMLGVPVKRIQTLVWGLAALLSFTGVFLKAGVVGLPFASNEGFGTTSFGALLAALAALTLGRFTNLPSVAVSAVALGILEQAVVWRFGNKPEAIYPVLAVVILVGLALRKTGQSRTAHDTADSWQASDEIRPIPLELRRVPEVAIVKWGGLALLAFVAFRLPSFGFMDSGNLIKASAVVLFGIVGVSIIMLTGWAGQVTLGQMAVVGVGAVTGAIATSEWGLDLSLAVLVGGLAGSVVAVIIGLPALRVRGMFLAVTTLAFAITSSNFLLNPSYFSWIPKGRIDRPPLFGTIDLESHANMYYLCLVVLIVTLLGVRGLRRSRTGRVMLALRENERAAQSFGISLTRAKLTWFALSGFFAAVAGALLVHVTQRFTAAEYGAGTSFAVFTSTVVGGLGSITGGLIGALFSRGGTWFLQGNWQLLPSAIGVLVVLLLLPSGLGGAAFRVRDSWLRSVARRYGVVVPSLLADVAQPADVVEQAELSVEHHEIDTDASGAIVVTDADDHSDDTPTGGVPPDGAPPDGTEPDPDPDHVTAEAAARLVAADRDGGFAADLDGGTVMITLPPPSTDSRPLLVRFASGLRHPVLWLRELTGGDPIYPLLILFGLNATDELDRTAFAVLLPNIQEAFGLDLSGILTLVALVALCGLLLQIPIAHFADRAPRVRLALMGASIWALFSVGTGLAVSVLMLGLMRTGSGVGKAVVDPTHNSLIADYYSVGHRPRVYSFHRAANALGQFLGPLIGGLLAFYGAQWFGSNIGWRLPFFVFAIPTVFLVIAGLKMQEPVRGGQERRAMGASEGAIATEEQAPSLEEATRMIFKIETLRRIYVALPFLAAALIGFASLAVLKYEALGLNEAQRGFAAATVEPFQLLGLYLGARIGTKLIQRDPGLVLKFIAVASFCASLCAALFALAPNIWVAMVGNIGISVSFAIVGPGVLATLSLAIPPRARSVGFSMSSLFVIPGLIMLPIVGWVGDTWGVNQGMLLMTPVIAIGGFVIASAGNLVHRDIKNVWTSAATRSEMLYDRRQGKAKLLLVRNLDVRYGPVQILFDVDFEVDEGEIVALLGTNGAGKSTLLKSICGVVEADGGAVVFDGRDITHAPPHEIAGWGIAMVPGGQGVFPTLTVEENLSVASWIERKRDRKTDGTSLEAKMAEVLETFPVLAQRLDEPAANLSGGQQQMLALGMAFLSEPKLLVIDELSLGLAPVIVEQLLAIVRRIKEQGTTIILVEQSVNVALTLAETAYFMEKGEIRFHGPTAELLERPDVLRSVFLEGAEKGMATVEATTNGDSGNGQDTTVVGETDTAATTGSTDDALLLGIGNGNGTGNGNGDGNGDGNGIGIGNGTVAEDGSTGTTTASNRGAAVASPDGDPEPALELTSVSVRFGGIRAVDDVSLRVAPGEIIGIIGPNGAGKTTLFDLISGFTRADGGRIVLNGRDVTGLRPDKRARLGLGRSFQDARLFPALTVEETITIALERFVDVRDPFNAMLHLPAQQDSESALRHRVDELIELMGIESFRSKFVRELSTGSRRVVDLACVLAHHPSVVLLDEPSSGIAQREAEALGPLILRIREALGASILVIEHDMPLVTGVADRLVALELGHVITTGDPADVLAHPDVLASYLGSTEDVIARSGSRAGT